MGQPLNALKKALKGITPAVDADLINDLFQFRASTRIAAALTGTNALAETWFGRVKQRCRLVAAYLVADAAITAHASNFATILIDKSAVVGGARTNVITFATDTVTTDDVAAGVAKALAGYFTSTDADLTFAEGDTLTLEVTKGGTGVTVPISYIELVFEPLDDA